MLKLVIMNLLIFFFVPNTLATEILTKILVNEMDSLWIPETYLYNDFKKRWFTIYAFKKEPKHNIIRLLDDNITDKSFFEARSFTTIKIENINAETLCKKELQQIFYTVSTMLYHYAYLNLKYLRSGLTHTITIYETLYIDDFDNLENNMHSEGSLQAKNEDTLEIKLVFNVAIDVKMLERVFLIMSRIHQDLVTTIIQNVFCYFYISMKILKSQSNNFKDKLQNFVNNKEQILEEFYTSGNDFFCEIYSHLKKQQAYHEIKIYKDFFEFNIQNDDNCRSAVIIEDLGFDEFCIYYDFKIEEISNTTKFKCQHFSDYTPVCSAKITEEFIDKNDIDWNLVIVTQYKETEDHSTLNHFDVFFTYNGDCCTQRFCSLKYYEKNKSFIGTDLLAKIRNDLTKIIFFKSCRIKAILEKDLKTTKTMFLDGRMIFDPFFYFNDVMVYNLLDYNTLLSLRNEIKLKYTKSDVTVYVTNRFDCVPDKNLYDQEIVELSENYFASLNENGIGSFEFQTATNDHLILKDCQNIPFYSKESQITIKINFKNKKCLYHIINHCDSVYNSNKQKIIEDVLYSYSYVKECFYRSEASCFAFNRYEHKIFIRVYQKLNANFKIIENVDRKLLLDRIYNIIKHDLDQKLYRNKTLLELESDEKIKDYATRLINRVLCFNENIKKTLAFKRYDIISVFSVHFEIDDKWKHSTRLVKILAKILNN